MARADWRRKGEAVLEDYGRIQRARRDGAVTEARPRRETGEETYLPAGEYETAKYVHQRRSTDRMVDDPPPGSPECIQVAAALTAIAKEAAPAQPYSDLIASVLRELVEHVHVEQRPVRDFKVPRLRGAGFGLGLGDDWVEDVLRERLRTVAERIGCMLEGK